MKIEAKLTIKNMRKNIRRTVYTTLSIALCTFLIFTTLLLISSIRNGINEVSNIQFNDYHFIIKELNEADFNKIKDKDYIDKIYIQKNENEPLQELDDVATPFGNTNKINIYIKYKNVKETYKYSSNIVQTLQYPLLETESMCEFNDKLLTVYGLMGANLTYEDSSQTTLVYKNTLNFSYVINLMQVLILLVFSILFIIILYNSFLITINERKKEYAILNSIGGTEGQILKMIFLEASIMGIFGIIIGGIISYIGASAILSIINNILEPTMFNFSLAVDSIYVIVALIIVIFNIYISSIIPSVKASNTSVIQNIRNNKQIKYKKRNHVLGKILPIEDRIALINLKRNKNKYRVITILLVICMVSFITVSTYINYEKETADIVTDYDVDAELIIDEGKVDYKEIFNNYTDATEDKLEYTEYKMEGLWALVEPSSAILTNSSVYEFTDNKKDIQIRLIGLQEKEYKEYIEKINADYGDIIIYNTILEENINAENDYVYMYNSIFNTDKLELSIINIESKEIKSEEDLVTDYEIIDAKNLKGKFVLTDELMPGFKEARNQSICTVFVNMDTYNKIEENVQNAIVKYDEGGIRWYHSMENPIHLKIKCENIIGFSNYINNIINTQNDDILANYYSLDNQEKVIYIDILQLILRTIILTIVIIGIISSINIISASLFERREEFNILSRLGATNGNINKIIIYECVHMFIKALIISVIISIPIIYEIIKHMKNVIVLKEVLIPFGSIGIFLALLFIISLVITLYSSKLLKNK